MHPSDLELLRYARTLAADRDQSASVGMHVKVCEQCRHELALMEGWLSQLSSVVAAVPVKRSPFEEVALGLLQSRPTVIALTAFEMPDSPVVAHALAADGTAIATPGLQHRATLYSEDPEVILRLMHDPVNQTDIVQLTAGDPALTRHVYIRLGDPPREILTDERGMAQIDSTTVADPLSLAWRLQLPDASFVLKPLAREKQEGDRVLDLPDGDQIAVTVLQDAAGISLRIRPLRIHGLEVVDHLRVVVCQSGGRWQVVDSHASGECVAADLLPDAPIEIRLFVVD